MLPWTPLSMSYSCVESHCWCGHQFKLVFLRTEGGSYFIRAVFRGLGLVQAQHLQLATSLGGMGEANHRFGANRGLV